MEQQQQRQQPLTTITNTINSRPSLLRKPTTINDRGSYPPSTDSKFIEQQPILTNSVIKLDGSSLDENSNSNNHISSNINTNSISNVSMQISQLNSSHNSRALLMQKLNNPTTNIRPTVKKKIDDQTHKPLSSTFKNKPSVTSSNPLIMNNNKNNNIKSTLQNNNTFKIPSPPSSSSSPNTSSSSSSSSPLSSSPSLLNSSIKLEKSNLFSSMYSTSSSSLANTQPFQPTQPLQQQQQQPQLSLQERMGKIDEFTQSFRGNLQTQFESFSESFKPPRLSLSINDIKTRLDYEEKNKEIERIKIEMKKLTTSYKEKENELMQSQYKVSELSIVNDNLNNQIEQSNKRVLQLEHEIKSSSLKSIEIDEKFNCMQSITKDRDDEINRLSELVKYKDTEIDQLKIEIQSLLEKSRADEKIRRQLHNTIQELKGNIRVFCRIRPDFNSGSGNGNTFYLPPGTDNSIEVYSPTVSTFNGEQSNKKTNYTFDKVFGPMSTQEQVFEDISQLVQSSLDGYNTCIFTYGQTGSGKTHTILGDLKQPSQYGMIPRTVEKIFTSIQELKLKGWNYQIECFFLEIYNETINDLLNTKGGDLKYEIKHNLENNSTTVTNITIVPIINPSKVYEILALANKTRSVAKTLCNERSSRSHTVFQLKLTGQNQSTGERVQGLLNLIDLAGSERVSRSGVEGKQLKETQAINKSLSSLGDVISALANKEHHIPYRNSKLTFLLQNSIGGNSKTLMFVNISPEFKDLQESTSSLRFASKVNSCEIGQAKKNNK